MRFIRFQAAVPNQRGVHIGVFGLVNGLASDGRLTDEQERFRRQGNDWYNANYTNPSDVDPTVYDKTLNPAAVAWFKESATHLVDRVDGYLAILAEHDIDWRRVESEDPGTVVYEDDDQVVVVPTRKS